MVDFGHRDGRAKHQMSDMGQCVDLVRDELCIDLVNALGWGLDIWDKGRWTDVGEELMLAMGMMVERFS